MEQKIKTIQVEGQTETLQQIANTPLYDHIILTDEEIKAWTEWGLLKGRKRKAAFLAESDYRKKISTDYEYPVFNFEQLKEYVLDKFLMNTGSKFIIDDSNREIFELLCMYFSNDPGFEIDGMSLNKGIMLIGPVGCGKTELMRLFTINSFRPYYVIACRKVADAFSQEGEDALYFYSKLGKAIPQTHFGHKEVGRCFDDFGTEDDKKNFGNSVNVMQDVLYKIYDSKLYSKFHITSNISGNEIDEIYGNRIRSRMREMFNVFVFDKTSPDRRK